MSLLCFHIFDLVLLFCFFFKQKTAYEMRISDWSSDVCSSDLSVSPDRTQARNRSSLRLLAGRRMVQLVGLHQPLRIAAPRRPAEIFVARPGDPLHRRDGGEDERDDGERRHGRIIDQRVVPAKAGDRKSTSLNVSPSCAYRMPSYS